MARYDYHLQESLKNFAKQEATRAAHIKAEQEAEWKTSLARIEKEFEENKSDKTDLMDLFLNGK